MTKRKNNEKTLLEDAAIWKLTLESGHQGLWDWYVPEKIIVFSSGWKRMLGYNDKDVKNEEAELESRIHPDDVERFWSAMNAHFKNQTKEYYCEARFRCKDGSYKWILDRGSVVKRAPNGAVLRVIGTHTDIGLLKQKEAELLQSKSDLADALFYNRNLIEANVRVFQYEMSLKGLP